MGKATSVLFNGPQKQYLQLFCTLLYHLNLSLNLTGQEQVLLKLIVTYLFKMIYILLNGVMVIMSVTIDGLKSSDCCWQTVANGTLLSITESIKIRC